MTNLSLSHEWRLDGVPVFVLDGEVDTYTAFELRDYIKEATDGVKVRHVVFDCKMCHYLDSTGLGVMVWALKTFRERTEEDLCISVAAEDEYITKIFRITGLTKIFDVVPSVQEVLDRIGESS